MGNLRRLPKHDRSGTILFSRQLDGSLYSFSFQPLALDLEVEMDSCKYLGIGIRAFSIQRYLAGRNLLAGFFRMRTTS